jgi:hypothetical protein
MNQEIVNMSFVTSLRAKADEVSEMPVKSFDNILKKLLKAFEKHAEIGFTTSYIELCDQSIKVFLLEEVPTSEDERDYDDKPEYTDERIEEIIINIPKSLVDLEVFNRLMASLHQMGLLVEAQDKDFSQYIVSW